MIFSPFYRVTWCICFIVISQPRYMIYILLYMCVYWWDLFTKTWNTPSETLWNSWRDGVLQKAELLKVEKTNKKKQITFSVENCSTLKWLFLSWLVGLTDIYHSLSSSFWGMPMECWILSCKFTRSSHVLGCVITRVNCACYSTWNQTHCTWSFNNKV